MLVHIIAIFLGLVGAATVWQFIRLARWPFRVAVILTLLLVLVSLQGCAFQSQGNKPIFTYAALVFAGLSAAECIFWWIARRDIPSLRYLAMALAIIAWLLLSGCATLPHAVARGCAL